MDKVKIKNLISNNKKKSVITLAILLISILLVSIIVYATANNDDYVVEIKDDGTQNIAENAESSITKKIIGETNKSLTYEVAITNKHERSQYAEIAVLVDTSSSMPINDTESKLREKAIEFVQGLFTNVNTPWVSLSNNASVKYYGGYVNYNNCAYAINSLIEGEGSNLSNGIDNALSTFTTNDNDKYLIIFSDATDPVLEKLQNATQNGINVYSILTDMTNNEYKENKTTVGNVQMISSIESFSPIYNRMNKSIVNVKVEDIFSPETREYFKITEGYKDAGVTFTETENGYMLECESIIFRQTKKAQFTLTLDENATIDSGKIYRDLNTSSKMTINYDNYTGDKRNYEMKNSPTYIICKKYSLTIEAVSEKSDKLPVSALQVNVVGTIVKGQDEEGNDIIETIYDEVLTTDSKGKIKVDNLKTLGDIKFEIKPIVNQLGYSDTDATTIIVHNDPKGVGTIWAESDVTEPEVDVINRNINVKLPISVQTFALRVETIDAHNYNIKLGNIEYRLIQPKLNSKYEMEALYAKTDENGNIIFRPTVMTKNGTYEYILSQLTEQEGYDSIGNVTLYVTFENGNVTKFSHKYNENVESEYISTSEEKVIVKNVSENTDTFRLEINVADSENSNKKLEGAIYNIEVTRVASNGEQITNTVNGCITNAEGKIELDLPGKGNVRVRITEVNPKTGYQADTQTKEIIFSRTEGRVQYITAKSPIDINALPDSDANALVVNFTSVERSAKNRVQIHMIDNDERDINIPGVNITLVNLINNKTYTAVSDGNGIANFLVDDEQPGIYAYDIMLTNGLPYGYINAENKLGGISVHFNDNKFIDECSDTGATVPYFSASYEVMDEDFSYHTGKVDIGLAPDSASTTNFQVKLVNDKNQNIQGAKYDITIKSGDVVRKITGRATDSNGIITTRLIGTDNIEIRVKQTETIQGHIINTEEQIIELTKINGIYQITHQEPYQYDGNEQRIGAIISGNNLIYFDVNKEKTGNDTRLNLYVNKVDTNNNLVGGVKTVITSPTLKLAGNAITAETNYSATAKSGNIFTLNPAVSDNNGYFEIEGIEVNGLDLNDGERVDYMYMYEVDVNGNKVANTDITLKLTFRYNENKGIVQITNVEATWGNRLISKRTFDGYETDIAYESNVYLDIYTNYDDVGNFSIDLTKTDKNNNLLQGAKYDVIVTRLDGTRIIRRGIEVTDSVEFAGLLVSQGTKIEITEVEAPIGYEVNEYTEILTIKTVDAVTGEMTVELERDAYATPRAELKPLETLILEDGTYKTCASLQLMDYELATFKFGIKAEDSTNGNPIEGYKFKISTSQGAQNNTSPTNKEGKAIAVVGANYAIDGFKVTYTVDTLQIADYYKKLANPIPVEVIFDLNGEVKTAETIAANEANEAQTGYGTLWIIENTNNTDSGNDIDIRVNIDPQDKLIVNIVTVDRRTKATIEGSEYKITPSINIPGTGSTRVEVGYVVPDGMRTYTIEQTADNIRYDHLANQTFKIEYDSNGNIKTVSDLSDHIASESHNGKTLTLTLEVDPTLTVNIVSKNAITDETINIIEYKITPASERIDATGTSRIEVGYASKEQEIEYTLSETNDPNNYVKLNNMKFKVEYDKDDKVINATTSEEVLKVVSHNDSSVNLEVSVEPGVPFVINNIGYFDNAKLSGGEFEITSETPIVKTTRTDIDGIAKTYVDKLQEDTTVTYKIKQTVAARTYCTVDDFEIEVTFNEDKEITDAKIKDGSTVNEHVTFVTVTHKQPSERTDEGYNGNDKGIINIEVKNYPAVQFEITNVDRQDNTKILSGTNYKVTSSTNEEDSATTDPTAITYLGKSVFSNKIVYTISEQSPSARYQTQVIDSIVEVEFDSQGKVAKATVTQREDITTATLPTTGDPVDSLKVNVIIQSNPQLNVAISKIDEETGETLGKVDFEVIARIEKQNLSNYNEDEVSKITMNTSTLTEEDYLAEALYRIKIPKENVETMKEEIGLAKIIDNLKQNGNLSEEEEDKVNSGINYSQKVARLVELDKATKTQIAQEINKVTNQEVVDKLIAEGKTTADAINDRVNELKNLVRLDVDRVTTDLSGIANAYMDKTLENKTIEYVLNETKKAVGYDWPDEEIRFTITYDSTGKMIAENPINVVSGNLEITDYNIDEFTINTLIKNTPSKETRIHLTVEDVYDSSKKLEIAKFDAYLTDVNAVNALGELTFAPDNKYRVALESGATSHGEDIETIGVYEEGEGNRVLRLVQKQTPNTYYQGDEGHSVAYQSIAYAMLFNVSFDDEGHVIGASIYKPGGDSKTIGDIADGRYLTVSYSKNTIEITVKYYPMVQIQMVTKDMYTNDALQASYAISTSDWSSGYNGWNRIKSGYINTHMNNVHFGADYRINYTTNAGLGVKDTANVENLYGAAKVALAPTEAESSDSRERTFYVYEMQEPNSPIQYQKYRNWYQTLNSERLIATIKVTYDEIGMVKNAELVSERSTNNIPNGFVEVKMNVDDGYTVQITVKYSPITTVTATVVDSVTGKGLNEIRINPYVNNTPVSNNSYEYRTQKYYTTGSSGTAGWTYWGASVEGGQVRYILDTYTQGTEYNGYFDPGNVILDVAYDENGRVTGVQPVSIDAYGDVNATNISWTNNDIRITIPYSRKFNVKLNKVDYYDSNIKLGAVFKVTTSGEADVNVAANSVNTIGKVYPGKTVKYTLSETTAPTGYVPINNLDFYVTFNNDGTVRSTTSESDYYKFVKSASADTNVNRINKTDLEVNIKNKPRFNVSIDLTDKFYPVLKLQGATFEMANSKGDTAQGEVVTDKNGILETYIGPIYPGEEVEYTIRQTGEVNGYYKNTTDIKFKVKFNESGRIESYSLESGSGIATIDPNAYVNTKGIHVSITNMPKDLKIGVYKYDELTNAAMDSIKFNTKVEEVGKVDKNTQVVTNADGSVAGVIDTFIESSDYRIVKYTISEIEVPNSYRKIQDVVIQVTFNKDGSMLLYDVLSNESDVGIEVATNKQIKYTNNAERIPVHIKLTIPNDNKYDLIIKNEDKNYLGLGIEGTVYDVTINGEELIPTATNTNGITKIVNRTEVGDITIKITERNIGEGYRQEPNNETTILVHKGEQEYSLKLDDVAGNSNPTYADVVVDEEHGTITVTFKNETKLELNIVKNDINTGEVLEGAIFAITSEEIDNRGNTVADTLQTITNTKVVTATNDGGTTSEQYQIDENEKTNDDGLLSFDLGIAHQNKTIKYTLVEVKAPEGYTEITPISVTVKFDAYGRITEMIDDSFRAECYLDTETGKSHNMIFNISNGTVDPQYTIKVVSEDSQTGTRINGSIFQVEIKDSEGITYKDATGTTRDVNRTVGNRTFVAEKGVMKVTGIKAEGDITISLNQIETATGYVYGSNKVSGNVSANAKFTVVSSQLEKDLELVVTDNGGFEVSVENTNREITIKVKNDPELTFDITKINGKTKEKLANAEFTVTSVIQTSATTVPTTLNEKSALTDENGHTTLNGGIIEAGRTIIYTLKETKMEGYDRLDNIVILVQYDTKGNIMYYEILSDVNDARILTNEEAFINETKRIVGESDIPGIVEVDFQTYKIPTGIGTKKLQLEVSNTAELGNTNDGYQVVIEKHHIDDDVYPELIPGVTFEIKVTQEYGKAETAWVDTTDNTGIIKSPYFDGYGYITVEIKEIATIEGFKLDYTTKTITFIRDKETHKLELVNLEPENIGYEFSTDNTKVILRPVNEVASNMYNMIINKVDKNTNTLITNNSAEFEIYRIDKYENVTEIENEETGEITYETEIQEIKQLVTRNSTGETGRIIENNLKAPEEAGTYRYVIKETKAPEGYILPTEEMELDVTFTKNEADELIITKVEVVKGNDNIKVAQVRNQLFNLIVLNENEKDIVQDGEYSLNILKVDKDKNAIVTDTAIFKLTNTQTNEVNYYETNEQGKLDIETFKMPDEEGKYTYKLNEVKAPNGYILNVNDIMLELEFAKDEEGKIYLKDVQAQGDNIEYEEPEEGSLPDTTITIKVTNEEGGSGTGNTNDKRYTFVLNKVDADTKEIITENVEFEVVLANGEIVKGKTNDEGQLRIEDVFMPAEPGEYELVIKEKTNPSGYKVDNEQKNVKVTFTGYGEDMIISDIKLGDTNNKNIEILQEKCSEQYIEVNILNEKDDYEKLYVVSKRYHEGYDLYDSYLKDKNTQSQIYKDGEEIYQVLEGFYGVEGYKNPHYTIDKPFIDTKIAKYKSYVLAEEFIGNLESNGHMEVLGYDGNPIGPKDHVGTGMTLRSTLGDQELTFTIVVKGDADYKDGEKTKTQIGRVSTPDLDKLIMHIAKEKIITDPIALRALDIDFDGRVRNTDLDKMYTLLGGTVYYDYFQNGIDKSDIPYIKP